MTVTDVPKYVQRINRCSAGYQHAAFYLNQQVVAPVRFV